MRNNQTPTPIADDTPLDPSAMSPDERSLRRLFCVAYAGSAAYMDDGEAQDNREIPSIDFLRDPAEVIRKKIGQRALLRLAGKAGA